jgi:tripeptide aminopeptidase
VKRWARLTILFAGVVLLAPAFATQAPNPAAQLVARKDVAEALRFAREDEPRLLEDQVRLCEIPAPPFKEQARAAAYEKAFQELGLRNVRLDKEGNVIGERPGRQARPHVVVSAHLDTVFPEGTDVAVKREGLVLKGPGIGDDCRGLAVVAGVARALRAANVTTEGTISFVGTVGEEGLGDLRGVRHLFATELAGRVDAFVSVDGGGLDITHVAVGSRRYRVTFKGPGGHSYGAFGLASPIHALGRAVARLSDFNVPTAPKTTFTVGRIGGGTSVNSIAFEAWMEMDMRSSDRDALTRLDQQFLHVLDEAASAENARWSKPGQITVEKTLVGDRPAGRVPAEAPIVRTAVAVTRALGLRAELQEGSTDANIPISLGVPAITIDGGGNGKAAHSLDETFDATDSWKGTQRALLLAIALADAK